MNFAPTSQPATNLARGNARSRENRVRHRAHKIGVPRAGKMERSVVREKIAKHGRRNSNVLAPAKPANKEKRHSCRFKERGRLAHTLIFQNTPPHDSRLPIDLQMAQFSSKQLKAAGLTSDPSAPIIFISR